MDFLSSKRKIVFALFNSAIDVGDCVGCCMRVSHMGVFHMSVFHLFWCNVPVHVAQKPARKGTQVFTNIWSVQIDIISHSLRRASSQNGTSHEGHEESSWCHWSDCPSETCCGESGESFFDSKHNSLVEIPRKTRIFKNSPVAPSKAVCSRSENKKA